MKIQNQNYNLHCLIFNVFVLSPSKELNIYPWIKTLYDIVWLYMSISWFFIFFRKRFNDCYNISFKWIINGVVCVYIYVACTYTKNIIKLTINKREKSAR